MMNAYVRPHPDGFKSYLGKDQKTGLYTVRVGWTVYETNANGSVLYIVKEESKIPLDGLCCTNRRKVELF
ncbi:hypothetical protein DU202_01408 [Acinetobacter baumannii DU202]|nr:hypothetical protein DU202_01408 [Acinetobacter baumannii DU202]